jgi:hypothetical protein
MTREKKTSHDGTKDSLLGGVLASLPDDEGIARRVAKARQLLPATRCHDYLPNRAKMSS